MDIKPKENQNKSQKSQEKSKTWAALSLAWELGYTIAIPIVIFALLGRVLDKKLGTSPWFLLVGIFLALLLTTILVYQKAIKIITEAGKEPPKKPKKNDESKEGINHKS